MLRILPLGIFVLLSASSFAGQHRIKFTSQPEAIAVEKEQVTISWSTNINSVGFVHVSTDRYFPAKEFPAWDERSKSPFYDFKHSRTHRVNVTGLEPGRIYYVAVCTMFADDTAWSQTKVIATQSASTGKFTIYFTSPVDTTVSTGVNATYLPGTIDDTLVQYINRTQYSLDIAIYNTTNSTSVADIAAAINAAYARGVRVRVIYDGSTGNTMIPNLNPGINRVASPQGSPYNIMHNKFVVMDADASDPNLPLVWTGSTNWTTSQVNGTDKNNVIIVQDQSLAQAYTLEFEEMWGDTGLVPNPNTARFGPDKLDNTPHLFNIGGVAVECYFSPSDSVNTRLLNTIGSADFDMEFATMMITRGDLANAIVSRVSAGVWPTYGLVNDSVVTLTWSTLKNGMLPNTMVCHLGQSGIMHHKYLIVDQSNLSSDPLVWTGSHNWTSAATNENDENTLIIHDGTVANIYYQNFVYLFEQDGGIMGTDDINDPENFSVYPNPASGFVTVNADEKSELRLFDITGREAGNWELEAGENQLDVSGNAKGVYLLRFITNNNSSFYKLIIE